MESHHIIDIGVEGGIGEVARHVNGNVLVFPLLDFGGKRSVIQTQVSCSVQDKGTNIW